MLRHQHSGATLHPDAHHPDEHRGRVLEDHSLTQLGVVELNPILVRYEGFSIVQLLDYFLEVLVRYPFRMVYAIKCFIDIL